jgi:hypothetical protein
MRDEQFRKYQEEQAKFDASHNYGVPGETIKQAVERIYGQ